MLKYKITEYIKETEEVMSEEIDHIGSCIQELFDMGYHKIKLYFNDTVVEVERIEK